MAKMTQVSQNNFIIAQKVVQGGTIYTYNIETDILWEP